MSGVIVVVIKPGIYLDAEWKALPEAAEGTTITVAGGAYADSLLADGYVVLPGSVEPVVIVPPVVQPTEPDPVVAVKSEPVVEPEPTKKKGK